MRYHGGDARIEHPFLRRWLEEGRLVPVCPEVVGGQGFTAARLAAHQIAIFSEDEIEAAAEYVAALENRRN